MAKVVFHRLAERELEDSAQYYNLECYGLGISFLEEVERCLHAISEHPEVGQEIRKDIRRLVLRKFPFSLLYSVAGGQVRILAVMHNRRRPMYWAGRH